jgi:hypothetical protein
MMSTRSSQSVCSSAVTSWREEPRRRVRVEWVVDVELRVEVDDSGMGRVIVRVGWGGTARTEELCGEHTALEFFLHVADSPLESLCDVAICFHQHVFPIMANAKS